MQVITSGHKLLLTGDIEKKAEENLVAKYGKDLQSSVMLIPHHGSKTSSSTGFVDAVRPKIALVSYSFANLYHFPHKQALDVYNKRDIPVFNTTDCGMISLALTTSSHPVAVSCFRKEGMIIK